MCTHFSEQRRIIFTRPKADQKGEGTSYQWGEGGGMMIRIRIRGSGPLTNGSGSGCGSCYFRQWPSRHQQKTNLKLKFFCLLLFEGTFTSFFKDKRSRRTRQDLICSNPTSHSHGPLGVQCGQNLIKLKMFLVLPPLKNDHFKIICSFEVPPPLLCSNQTGNGNSPLGVQFRKILMILKMFLVLLAISKAYRKIDHFNIFDLLKSGRLHFSAGPHLQ